MRKTLTIICGLVVILAAAWAVHYLLMSKQPIRPDILRQAGFGVWYPAGKPVVYKVDGASERYSAEGSDKLVTFNAVAAGNTLSFTEQAVPESITDVPQVYDKMIEKLRGYSSFDSVNGTVALTRPEELQGRQTAVMKAKGTLVFIKPERDLSTEQWRQLMNSLSFIH